MVPVSLIKDVRASVIAQGYHENHPLHMDLIVDAMVRLDEGKSIGTLKGGTFDKDVAASVLAPNSKELKRKRRNKTDAAKRTLKKLKRTTQGRMENAVVKFYKGDMTRSKMIRELKAAIQEGYAQAYELGLRTTGVAEQQRIIHGDALSEQDKKFVLSAFRQEAVHLNKLIGQILARAGEIGSDEVLQTVIGRNRQTTRERLGNYVSVLDSMFNGSRVFATPANYYIFWVLESENPCPECVDLHRFSPHTKLTIPTTPKAGLTRCFVGKPQWYRVMTVDGPKPINKIQRGELVLTHEGTFRKVTGLYHEDVEDNTCPDETVIRVVAQGKEYFVTDDHKFLGEAGWLRADRLAVGSRLVCVSRACKQCGTYIDWAADPRSWSFKFCSAHCKGIYVNSLPGVKERQSHRERERRVGKTYEEIYGISAKEARKLGKKCTATANDVTRGLSVAGSHNFQTVDPEVKSQRAKYANSKRTVEGRRRAGIMSVKAQRTRGYVSGLERAFMGILRTLGVQYKHQVAVGKFVFDFYLPEFDVYVETDGDYWHANPAKYPAKMRTGKQARQVAYDRRKDEFSKEQGLTLRRFWEVEVHSGVVETFVSRLQANHDGEYGQSFTEVSEVERVPVSQVSSGGRVFRRMYCLEVEGAHSFVMHRGLVSHNCLTNCLCELRFEEKSSAEVQELNDRSFTTDQWVRRLNTSKRRKPNLRFKRNPSTGTIRQTSKGI